MNKQISQERKNKLTKGPNRVLCSGCNRAIYVDGNLLTDEELKLIDQAAEVTHRLCDACLISNYPPGMVEAIRNKMKSSLY